MIKLYNAATDELLGEITDEQLQLLQDQFEVTVVSAEDPAQTADFVVVVGKSSPSLKPKAGQ